MQYAAQILWFQRHRYVLAVLAVAVSTVLIALEVGILVGLISLVSTPIDMAPAQIWVTAPETHSCDLGRRINTETINLMLAHPEVRAADQLIHNFAFWSDPSQGRVLVVVVGCNLGDGSLGPVSHLSYQQRVALTEPGSVLLDRDDRRSVGIDRVGQRSEINGRRIRVVGFVDHLESIIGPYVLCSLETARHLCGFQSDQATFLLARCHAVEEVSTTARALSLLPKVEAVTAEEFSRRSRLHWLSMTKAGLAIGFVAALGLVIGTIVTSQTMYSAVYAASREFAILRALGAPRRRLVSMVLQQSVLIGVASLAIGLPLAATLVYVARQVGARAVFPGWLILGSGLISLFVALLSGLLALRSLVHADPVRLLR